jgi:poly(3-hydroxybutyrate) depolymerase
MLFLNVFFSFAVALPTLNIAEDSVTVSGVSSGAHMAVQMQVAHSSLFQGVASIAGGNYWCAKGSSFTAQLGCMGLAAENTVTEQVSRAQSYSDSGLIDPIGNIANHKIYVFASPSDSIIHPKNSRELLKFYENFRSPEGIQFENSVSTGHGFPTLNYGASCQFAGSPWLLDCDFDLAGEIMKSMYGELKSPSASQEGSLAEFSQSGYGSAQQGLYSKGWIYVPQTCQAGKECKLHMALHGCQMNPDFIQDQFVKFSGLNDWAEANDVVVLYPQAAKISGSNPYGCWDWFGFTDENYANQKGPQIQALRKMIKKISGF